MIVNLDIDLIKSLTSGEYLTKGKVSPLDHIITDSRKVIYGEAALFIALQGPHFDGTDFLKEAYDKQVRNFIVSHPPVTIEEFPNSTFILVKDTLAALQSIAKHQRSQFKGRVIGITGSNGKTIVKEWLGQVLSLKFPIAKSPKSYNSQVGVPLSVFGISEYHKVAILEAGISKPHEMRSIRDIIAPDLMIFTNLGTAHQEGFQSKSQKIEEKAILGEKADFIIYRKDHLEIASYLESKFPESRLISWSETVGADYSLSVKKGESSSKIVVLKPDFEMFTFTCSFTDEASLENIRHVIVAALTLGLSAKEVEAGLTLLKPLEMRLTIKPGANNSLIIDDTYNNDLEGLKVALEFMQLQRPKKRKILILSDFLQVGASKELYEKVAELLIRYNIDILYGIGEDIKVLSQYGAFESNFYEKTEDFIKGNEASEFDQDLILVTGARKFKFEKIINHLQQRVHGTTLEINLNGLSHNFNFYKQKLNPGTKIMVMVKAFAYGGGSAEIANHLQQLKADYLAVAYTDEGVYLREQGITLPIMVLNPALESFPHLVKHQLEPVVYSLNHFRQLGRFCDLENATLNIHLDLDTGMHRLGLSEDDLPELFQLLTLYPLRVQSLYTHLVGADEQIHHSFSLEQLQKFTDMAAQITRKLDHIPFRHALNSAGIISFPEYQMDMVRLGIGLYGVEVTGKESSSLQAISTLKTTISQIKKLQMGQTVGYGRKGLMKTDGQIATIAIGYADGYDRRFSNGKGYVLVHGQKAPVIGNVCMDMTMVDITGIPAKEGDEVIIYGEGISLQELATSIDTIPYELLTNISSRVKRLYFMD